MIRANAVTIIVDMTEVMQVLHLMNWAEGQGDSII